MLEKILCVDEIPKIMTFCEHVMTRQIALFEEYRETKNSFICFSSDFAPVTLML